MLSFKDRLKEILLRDKLLPPESLEKVLDEQKKTGGELSRILLKHKLINEDQLCLVLSEALDVPFINLSVFRLDPLIVKIIPKEFAQEYKMIPISRLGNQLTVAMVDPQDVFAIDNAKALTNLSVNVVIAKSRDIISAIDRLYDTDSSSSLDDILKDIKSNEDVEIVKTNSGTMDRGKIEKIGEDAPIITLVNTIIEQAVIAKASDVFLEPMETTMRIRYRVDGMIREIDRMPKVFHFPVISRVKVISSLDISEHRLPQDGRFRIMTSQGLEVDFRVNVLPTSLGEKIVLRILDKNLEVHGMDKLGFEPKSLANLKESCERPHGMILACGPTGSGKTTTLYSILKHIDTPGKNIITVEDPVEFQVKGLNQVNIRAEVGLTFPSSLRAILRQDPDVILIGEVRDAETLDIAVKAALTGHLVLTSLHTTTAAGSITRMVNMGIEPFLLCSSVIAIVAQRLVRKVCVKCREAYTLNPEAVKQFKVLELVPDHNLIFYRPKGCNKCFNSGYQGRVGITEILIMTNKIKELILEKSSELDVKNASRQAGMLTMREDAVIKASQGLTTLEEVVRLTAPDNNGNN